MGRWANLAELAVKDLAKVAGVATEDVEQAAATAEKLARAAQDAELPGRLVVKRTGMKPDLSGSEISQARKDLGIGWIFNGSNHDPSVELRASRTALGVMLEVPKGHEFEISVMSNSGYAERGTRLADGSKIFEHSQKGIVVDGGARKLHMGVGANEEHFVKALEPAGVGIHGPETATEMYYRLSLVGHEGRFYSRDVYAKPQTVHIAEDATVDNAVQVTHDPEVQRIAVRVQDPEKGLAEHWFNFDGKPMDISFRVVPLENVNK